jgi:hypothetical protein
VIVHGPASPAANPDPVTVKDVPAAAGGPTTGGDPLIGEIAMVAAASTTGGAREYVVRIAVMKRRIDTVTLETRCLFNTKHATSLWLG